MTPEDAELIGAVVVGGSFESYVDDLFAEDLFQWGTVESGRSDQSWGNASRDGEFRIQERISRDTPSPWGQQREQAGNRDAASLLSQANGRDQASRRDETDY